MVMTTARLSDGDLDAPLARLERIDALETQIAGLQALQVQETARYAADRCRVDQALGVAGSSAAFGAMAAEVALAKRVSQTTAAMFLDTAELLVGRHPATLAAFQAGRLGLYAAQTIANTARVIDDPDLITLADAVCADEAAELLPGQVAAMAQRVVLQVDPDAAQARVAVARRGDHVGCHAVGDDTAYLNAQLPVDQAAACWHALHDNASAARAAGDPRTIDKVMCDTLVERVTGLSHADRVKADVVLVMTDTALLGLDDTPAHLIGSGPVTAALARLVAASQSSTLRRLYTDPFDGTVSHIDTRRRLIDGALRDLVTTADQRCRGINCTRPICDVDHVIDHRRGGESSFTNAQGLSKRCHLTKDHPQMRVEPADPALSARAVRWTTPSGLIHTTIAPAALGPGSLSASQRQHRTWLTHPPASPAERQLIRVLAHHTRHKARQPDCCRRQ